MPYVRGTAPSHVNGCMYGVIITPYQQRVSTRGHPDFFRQTKAYPVPASQQLRRRVKLVSSEAQTLTAPHREELNVNVDSRFLMGSSRKGSFR